MNGGGRQTLLPLINKCLYKRIIVFVYAVLFVCYGVTAVIGIVNSKLRFKV